MTSLCFKINGNVKVSKDNKIVIATKTDIHLRLNLDQNKLKFKFLTAIFGLTVISIGCTGQRDNSLNAMCVNLHITVSKKLQHSDSQVCPSIPTNTATLQGRGHFNWPTSEP